MDPIPLEELLRFDETLRPLVPLGANDEQATVHVQRYIAHLDLTEGVPDGLRASYERIRTTYAYGVLNYDFYTVAYDAARLLPEQALRERFMIDHPHGAFFRNTSSGEERTLNAENYENLHEQIRRLNRQRGWKLQLDSGGAMHFDGMLTALTLWAREESLLHGQRNRRVESLLADMRNRVAHPSAYHRAMPGDAAQAIADSAEIINRLWGQTAGGGRMYPAPRRREIIIIGWNGTTIFAMHPAAAPPAHIDDSKLTCVVVKADPEDDVLTFDALYETTRTPIELLWGAGSLEDALQWVGENEPNPDEINLLDRNFLVRYHDGRVEIPRRPEIAAGLPEDQQNGEWILITADNPLEVFHHARQVLAGGYGCAVRDYCEKCAVNTVAHGPLPDMIAALDVTVTPRTAPDLYIPGIRAWPRWNEIIEGTADAPGYWTVPSP